VAQGKGLSLSALETYGVDSEEAVADITYNGKNKMPGFGEGCTPQGQCTFGPRLSDEEVQAVAEYVLKVAQDDGWKNVAGPEEPPAPDFTASRGFFRR